jgi:transcriptional regulator of arginine metabolism
MKIKTRRLETIKQLISSQQLGSQADLLRELRKEGYFLTQATLSRDLKQLKVAKAATIGGQYIYVLPNETMYHRVHTPRKSTEVRYGMGFQSIKFSGNIGVIHTNPGYASSLAFNIDNDDIPEILGTIAGDDTIFIAIADDADHNVISERIKSIISL